MSRYETVRRVLIDLRVIESDRKIDRDDWITYITCWDLKGDLIVCDLFLFDCVLFVVDHVQLTRRL